MRRKNEHETNGNGAGHIKFRVVEFEIDGGNEMLAEGIKALTTALSKSSATTTSVQQRALPAAKHATATVAEVEPGEAEVEETAELPFDDPEETTTTPRAKRQPYVPHTPDVLSDIDLNSGKVSLRNFMEQKNPSDNYDRYAAIAVWYKENQGLDEVNDDRIYTAFRFLEWNPPNDVGQVLRDLKAKKKWFDKGATKGGYKINIIGINRVHGGFK